MNVHCVPPTHCMLYLYVYNNDLLWQCSALCKLGTHWVFSVLYVFAYKLCAVCFLLQGDYRQLVHELDQVQYMELRLVVLEIRNTYVRHLRPVFNRQLLGCTLKNCSVLYHICLCWKIWKWIQSKLHKNCQHTTDKDILAALHSGNTSYDNYKSN